MSAVQNGMKLRTVTSRLETITVKTQGSTTAVSFAFNAAVGNQLCPFYAFALNEPGKALG